MFNSKFISKNDGTPMYLQIIESIKYKVVLGDWPAGFQLPSIRELALQEKVSVITVKQAYQKLNEEGVIKTYRGKGTFVAHNIEQTKDNAKQDLILHLNKAIKIADSLKMTVNDLQALVEGLCEQY